MWNLQNQSKHEIGTRFYNTLWFPTHQWDSGNAHLTKAATTTTMSLPRICFFPLSGLGGLKNRTRLQGGTDAPKRCCFHDGCRLFFLYDMFFLLLPFLWRAPWYNGGCPHNKILPHFITGDCAIARTLKLSSAIASLKSALQTPSSLEH